jgi:hypothetical protein
MAETSVIEQLLFSSPLTLTVNTLLNTGVFLIAGLTITEAIFSFKNFL